MCYKMMEKLVICHQTTLLRLIMIIIIIMQKLEIEITLLND